MSQVISEAIGLQRKAILLKTNMKTTSEGEGYLLQAQYFDNVSPVDGASHE